MALNCVIDRIKSVLLGTLYVDNVSWYVQNTLMYTKLVKEDYGMITDFHRELIEEINIYLYEVECDPAYQNVIEALGHYTGRQFTILSAFEWGITLHVEV